MALSAVLLHLNNLKRMEVQVFSEPGYWDFKFHPLSLFRALGHRGKQLCELTVITFPGFPSTILPMLSKFDHIQCLHLNIHDVPGHVTDFRPLMALTSLEEFQMIGSTSNLWEILADLPRLCRLGVPCWADADQCVKFPPSLESCELFGGKWLDLVGLSRSVAVSTACGSSTLQSIIFRKMPIEGFNDATQEMRAEVATSLVVRPGLDVTVSERILLKDNVLWERLVDLCLLIPLLGQAVTSVDIILPNPDFFLLASSFPNLRGEPV